MSRTERNERTRMENEKSQNCKLCPLTEVAEQEVLSDYTVLYGYNEKRVDQSGSEGPRRKVLNKHLEALKLLMISNPAKFKA